MPVAEAADYAVNPFDLTKVWPYKDYPLIEVGRLVLDRNADNYFADVEQSAFNPANFVPGVGPSPDKMLQGRLFAYGDAHRYRLGINHTRIPVNAPHATRADNYGRDGAMRVDENGNRSKNYEPNSFDGPVQTNEPLYGGLGAAGVSGTYEWDTREDGRFRAGGRPLQADRGRGQTTPGRQHRRRARPGEPSRDRHPVRLVLPQRRPQLRRSSRTGDHVASQLRGISSAERCRLTSWSR